MRRYAEENNRRGTLQAAPGEKSGPARALAPSPVVGSASDFSPSQVVGVGLRETYNKFARELTNNVAPLGVSITMWFVLRALWQEDGLKQTALANRIGVSPAAVVKLLNELHDLGLVSRRRGADRRASHVFLTRKGNAIRAKATALALATDTRALQGFSADEIKSLLDMLARLRANLDEKSAERLETS